MPLLFSIRFESRTNLPGSRELVAKIGGRCRRASTFRRPRAIALSSSVFSGDPHQYGGQTVFFSG